jgi:hypothetical protein
MHKPEANTDITEILRPGPIEWPKKGKLHALLKKLSGEETEKGSGLEICYEDDDVIAFHEVDEDPSHAHKWAVRVTVAPKRHVTTLLDLGCGDARLTCALLNGVQKAALALDLHKTGFEVYAGVLPPFQQNAYLTLKIRSGKHAASGGQAEDAAANAKA